MQLDPDGQETWEGNNEMKLLIIFRIFQSRDQKVTYSIKKTKIILSYDSHVSKWTIWYVM